MKTVAAVGLTIFAASAVFAAPVADTSGGWAGRTASAFTLPDNHGVPVDLGKVIGTRPVVLVFYRGVWCPFYQAQIGKDKAAFVKSGAAVYALSDEDPAAQKKMQAEYGLDFIAFLSDKAGLAARKYVGVYEGRTTLKPAVFVIGKNGKVKYAYLNDNFRLRAADQDILQAVKTASR